MIPHAHDLCITGRTCEDQLQHIFTTLDRIPRQGITLVVGPNGSGKSLLRNLLMETLKEEGFRPCHTSMTLRTQSHSHLGAMSGFASDLPWIATSNHTLHLIDQCSNSAQNIENSYWVLDEPEIGCSEETEMALAPRILERVQNIPGCTIITHSRHLAKCLREHFHAFFDLGTHESLESWIQREIVPTDLELLESRSFFRYIRGFMKNS